MESSVLREISKDEHERAKYLSRKKYEMEMVSNLLTAEGRGKTTAYNELKPVIAEKDATIVKQSAEIAKQSAEIAELSALIKELQAKLNKTE